MVIVCPLVYIWGFYICMHTTMANENYEKDWKKFLKCKECGKFKEINSENWYSHKEWYLWVLWRCRECILNGRKTEHEIQMARVRDRDRYKNNPKRHEYIWIRAKKRRERHMKENPNRIKHHERCSRLIDRLWIRPLVCPICWYEWRIVAHHPNINIWNEVVFCCQPCHDKIHKNKIECPKPINILVINQYIPCECEDE